MKKIGSKIFLLIIISLLVIFLVLKDNYNEIIEALKNANILYVLLGFGVVLIGDLFKCFSITTIVKKHNSNYKYKNGFLLNLQTNFFNGITPFSLGGQPFQIYSLKKYNKIKYSDGAKIIFKDFYSYQMSLIIFSTICLVVNNLLNIVKFNSYIKILILFGYLLNLTIALFLIYLPYSKNFFNIFFGFVINILFKIRIIKNIDVIELKFNRFILDFKNNIKSTLKNKKLIIKCIIFNFIKIITLGIAAYFSFKSVGINLALSSCIIITIITITMASFIPIPGSSGGIEYGFITLFSLYAINAKLSASLLIWRFITYYGLVLFGGVVFALKSRE